MHLEREQEEALLFLLAAFNGNQRWDQEADNLSAVPQWQARQTPDKLSQSRACSACLHLSLETLGRQRRPEKARPAWYRVTAGVCPPLEGACPARPSCLLPSASRDAHAAAQVDQHA